MYNSGLRRMSIVRINLCAYSCVRTKRVNVEKINELLVGPNELSDTGLYDRAGFQCSIYPTS